MEAHLATAADLPSLSALDRHLPPERLARKVEAGEVAVALLQGHPVGLLRFGLFWDQIPFMWLLAVEERYRRQGVGRALVRWWEQEMAARGHDWVLTSTQADEAAQHFYRALGYQDCGALLLPGEAAELLLRKEIAPPAGLQPAGERRV